MKLIKLSANQPSFRTIEFNRRGLTLILGTGSKNSQEDSSNGVGKTLALGLLHHCLGANAQPKFKEKLSDWTFSLYFELNGQEHKVERSADGKEICLDGEKLSLIAYRNWLDSSGAFNLPKKRENLTFRSLFTRFARHLQEDCQYPDKTRKEPEVEAQLRTFFLLGLEDKLVVSKKSHKKHLDDLKKTIKNWETDPTLHEIFRAGHEPKLRVEWLEKEIPRLEKELAQFSVAENYYNLEQDAQKLTQQLREIEKQININKFQLEGIEKSLKQHPDISRVDLLNLYEGLQATFKPEVLTHFEAVETFHQTFLANRKKRLEADKWQITRDIVQQEEERQKIGQSRDDLMRDLQGKRALDEYTALSNHLAGLKAERDKLLEYLSFVDKRREEVQALKEKMLQEENQTTEYVKTEPVAEYSKFFQSITKQLYPKLPSGIVLENNTGENQLRYELSVRIEGDSSDGINSARILCFDWLLLMHGKNHHLDFLWHDNRLFAHIDQHPRAAWFKFVLEQLKYSDKQYIATINTENYESMQDFLDDSQKQQLENSIKLRLRDDDPKNKLLGIQFG
jgi:uncharacterized protein YydD (DUF2326 family)